MCKVGDIILVKHYVDNGNQLGQHSFVILNDSGGTIEGLDFDIVCNVMSSFKSEEQKQKKLKYPGNFPVTIENIKLLIAGNTNSGYIKADQLYYFKKEKIDFVRIGFLTEETLISLIEFIESLSVDTINIVDNL